MAKNPHFRVLALSATPGGDPEKVQCIIDHLHISRIEIRDERSLDLREYMFTKEVKQHIIPMNEDVNKIKDLIAKLMEVITYALFSPILSPPPICHRKL
jgi:ATP-dependent DNA helicase MPH1